MKTMRKLGRGVSLVARWATYLLRQRLRRHALADLGSWLRTTLLGRSLADAGLPWFTFPCTRWLAQRLTPGYRVFEWGSGASTLFFLRRRCTVVSIEHDGGWFEHLRHLPAVRGGDVDLRLVPVQPLPDATAGCDDFSDYVSAIDDFPDGTFDLIVVDGRQRGACLRRASSKVAPGGLLLLDDSEREAYAPYLAELNADEWRTLHFPGPRPASIWPVFSRTTVLLRRGDSGHRRGDVKP